MIVDAPLMHGNECETSNLVRGPVCVVEVGGPSHLAEVYSSPGTMWSVFEAKIVILGEGGVKTAF